jgi:hypothetical protein
MNITNHHHLSLPPDQKQYLLYQFRSLSTSPVMPLREAECVSEGVRARTT